MAITSYLRHLLLAMGALLLMAPDASALQFKRLPFDHPLLGIAATGPIVTGDLDRLSAFIKTLSQSDGTLSLFVDSPGGNIFEASKIAALINKSAAVVTIPSGSQCSSACFLLFAAAAHRFMAPDALVGVHSASYDGQENLTSMGITTAFARSAADYGVPPAIIGKMVQTEPGRMTWLTPSDLQPMGVVILTPSSPQAQPLPEPAAQPSTAPESPARPSSAAQRGDLLVLVAPVLGFPAEEGNLAFTWALGKTLSDMGVKVVKEPGENVYTIMGRASLGNSGFWGLSRPIRIDWRVLT